MGVEKNYNKAAYWYRKAAAQGNSDAIRRLKALRVPLEDPK
jgi:TPR repeat protein